MEQIKKAEPSKMDKWLSLFFPILLTAFLLQYSDASPEYSRPHPRRLIFTSHDRPESDPQQVHISLAGKDHMRVSWVTSDKHGESVVEYGKAPGRYDKSATGDRTSYHYFLYSSGEIHHVTIGPLEPRTTYFYRRGGSGPEFSFRTPPSTFPVEFAVAGDWFLCPVEFMYDNA